MSSRLYAYDTNISSNIYNCNYTNDITNAKNNYYNNQKKNTLDPKNGNIITKYTRDILSYTPINHNTKYEHTSNNFWKDLVNRNTIGLVDKMDPSNITSIPIGPEVVDKVKVDDSNSFEKQFELCTFTSDQKPQCITVDKRAPISLTTYNRVSDEDFVFENMVPHTKSRDKIINDYNSTHALTLATFTGQKLKPTKTEVEYMFSQDEYKDMNKKLVFNTDDVRNRYNDSVGLKQNNIRPFEPEQVGPGLGLNYNVQSLGGFRDTARVMPRDTDALRAANNPKLSYTTNINQGSRTTIPTNQQHIGEVRKYKPEKFTEYGADVIWAGKAAHLGPLPTHHFVLKDTNRKESAIDHGYTNATNKGGIYHLNLEGNATSMHKTQLHTEGIPVRAVKGGIKRYNQGNDSSYVNYITQRSTTNNSDHGFVKGAEHFNTVHYTDDAKPTIREDIATQLNTNIGRGGTSGYHQQHIDEAKATIRENIATQLNTNIGHGGTSGYHQQYTDEAKTTIREDTATQLNTNIGRGGTSGYHQQHIDEAKATIRENIATQLNTNIGRGGTSGYHQQYTDEAKATIRENIATQLNTNIGRGGTSGYYQDQKDEAKATIRENMSSQLNTNIGRGGVSGYYQDQKDEAKATIRETTASNLNTNIGKGGISGYYQDQKDEAKATIKETTSTHLNLGVNSNASKAYYQNLKDEARSTIREDISTQLNSNVGPTAINREAIFYKNTVETSDGREIVAKQRIPTTRGAYNVPNKQFINIELKDDPKFDPLMIRDGTNKYVLRADTEYNLKKNNTQQTMPIFDANFLNIMNDTLENNPIVNNLIHKSTLNIDTCNPDRIFEYSNNSKYNYYKNKTIKDVIDNL